MEKSKLMGLINAYMMSTKNRKIICDAISYIEHLEEQIEQLKEKYEAISKLP